MSHRPQQGLSAPSLLAAALAIAVLAWMVMAGRPTAPAAAASGTQGTGAQPADARRGAPGAAPASSAPFSPAGRQARQAQLGMWQQRLERAQGALAAYRAATRYPDESRPLAEHADQSHPHREVAEQYPLRVGGGKAGEGAVLHTTQERQFMQGDDTVRLTVSLRDRAGNPLPLRIVRAFAAEVPPPRSASIYPRVPVNFNDEGRDGDTAAGDGVFGVRLQPGAQGFAGLFGQIRVELHLQHSDQPSFTYFDIVYSAEPPAAWLGGVREVLEDGSLSFYLKASVRQPGRYVVSGRIDDAQGKPVALLTFNEEVAEGPQEFRLTLFGKLVRDARPAFPLTLRDVDAFLLRPDAFPDRRTLPRLAGPVHASRDYPLASFSEAEWDGEQRERYLEELARDVAQAQARVDQLSR